MVAEVGVGEVDVTLAALYAPRAHSAWAMTWRRRRPDPPPDTAEEREEKRRAVREWLKRHRITILQPAWSRYE